MKYEESNIKLSFIIPCHNAESTIFECLNSIEKDIDIAGIDKTKIEIITVENGSKDSTDEAIINYQKAHSLIIHLLHTKEGVSNARNAGILSAKGEYITFLDADDIWLRNSLSILEKHISRYKPDIAVYGFIKGARNQADNLCQQIVHKYPVNRYAESEKQLVQMRAWLISKPTHRMQAWAKIYKRDFLKDNNLLFNSELCYSEDSEFVLRCLLNAKRLMISDKAILHYVLSSSSVMHSTDSKRTIQYISSLNFSWIVVQNESAAIRKAFNYYVLVHLNLILVHDIYEVKNSISWGDRKNKLNTVLQNEIFKNAIQQVALKDCMQLQLLPELMLKLNLKNCMGVLCIARSWMNNKKADKK